MKWSQRDSNENLLIELFTSADQLGRASVDELILRADELLPELKQLVMDRHAWQTEVPEWWAPVHATYILGAIGGERVVTALLSALRWSDAFDNDWVTEVLPAIFGSLGEVARIPLEQVLADESAGIGARGLALDGLAAQSLWHPQLETTNMPKIISLFRNRKTALELRLAAASILLDFRYRDLRDELVSFVELDAKQNLQHMDLLTLSADKIDAELAQAFRAETYYKHDWLSFYDSAKVSQRLLIDSTPRVLH